jgi:hypothetical protein
MPGRDWRFSAVLIFPFLVFAGLGLVFFVYGSSRYTLTEREIIWRRFGREKRLAYLEIRSADERGYTSLPALILRSPSGNMVVSRMLEGYPELYKILSDHIPALRQELALSCPWRIFPRPSFVILNLLGVLALLGFLTGLSAMLIFQGGAHDWLMRLGLVLLVMGILFLMIVLAFLTQLNFLLAVTFDRSEVRILRVWGVQRIPLAKVRSIGQRAKKITYRGLSRRIYPLIIDQGGSRAEIPDEFASACGLSLERLAFTLDRLYLGRVVQPETQAGSAASEAVP